MPYGGLVSYRQEVVQTWEGRRDQKELAPLGSPRVLVYVKGCLVAPSDWEYRKRAPSGKRKFL